MSTPRVVVLDYGSGNLRSAERALAHAEKLGGTGGFAIGTVHATRLLR